MVDRERSKRGEREEKWKIKVKDDGERGSGEERKEEERRKGREREEKG